MYLGEIKVVLCDTLCCAVLGNKNVLMASFAMCPRYFGLLRDGHQFSLLAAHSFLFRNGHPLLLKNCAGTAAGFSKTYTWPGVTRYVQPATIENSTPVSSSRFLYPLLSALRPCPRLSKPRTTGGRSRVWAVLIKAARHKSELLER